jgi:hypothetical protein
MTTAYLYVNVSGMDRVRRVFAGLAFAIADMSPVYRLIADDLRQKVWPDWWASEGQGSWAYRREERRYVAFKRKIFGTGRRNPPVLRWIASQNRKSEAGELLYPSFTERADPNHVEDITAKSLSVGSALPYAEDHHEGRGRGPEWAGGYPLPRRRLVELGASDTRRWDGLTQRWLDDIGALADRGESPARITGTADLGDAGAL